MAELATCPRCGQLIPPENPFRGQPVKASIYRYVAKHPEGVTREQIEGHVYADDPDGGPGPDVVAVHISSMNKTLCGLGVRIRSTRGRGALYRLERL